MAPKRRAERYEMILPLRYRRSQSGRWEGATTLNVSHNGVLARAGTQTEVPSGPVDFVMALPPCGVVQLARIRCSGQVVRVAQSADGAGFALSIDRYRFMKPGEDDESG